MWEILSKDGLHRQKDAGVCSDNYKKAYVRQSEGKDMVEKLYLRILLVTDYICGMTDSYAKRLYQELTARV